MPISADRTIFEIDLLKPEKNSFLDSPSYLGDLDFSFPGEDTQYSTHNLHPYVAAINPPLVKALIDNYVPIGENILDPYCGGGGVLVESVINNRPCAGGDINPLAVLISKAKTTHVSRDRILSLGKEILESAKKKVDQVDLNRISKNIRFWFKESSLKEIEALKLSLDLVVDADDIARPLFQVLLSGMIRDVMLTYRGEIRLRKLREEDLKKFRPDTFLSFKKRLYLASERVPLIPQDAHADIGFRDVRKQPFESESFHSIICSPPYADDKNGVGYFQFSKNMLAFLGIQPEEIKAARSLFHGMTKEEKNIPSSASLALSLSNVQRKDLKKHVEAVAFYSDYQEALAEMKRVTQRKIIIVIGNRVLARTVFDNAAITVEIMDNLGVKLEHHYTRELRRKRIPNLGADGGGIHLEHILVFKK